MTLPEIDFVDAATNCAQHNGVATLTLRSGVQFEGLLERPAGDTLHMKIGDGWATVALAEVVAVSVRRLP